MTGQDGTKLTVPRLVQHGIEQEFTVPRLVQHGIEQEFTVPRLVQHGIEQEFTVPRLVRHGTEQKLGQVVATVATGSHYRPLPPPLPLQQPLPPPLQLSTITYHHHLPPLQLSIAIATTTTTVGHHHPASSRSSQPLTTATTITSITVGHHLHLYHNHQHHMESDSDRPEATVIKWCDCGCDCCSAKSNSGGWIRSSKRKLDERDDDKFVIPGLLISDVARVDIGNECVALREMVSSQQETIQEMSIELDEERNAAASAANEAMSMILRLQREKAEVQMEARQFKRFSEEKMAHDQQEIMAMEEFLYKREQTIQALTCEVQAYKHRMLSYGLTESEVEGMTSGLTRSNSLATNLEGQYEFPAYNYPPLKCNLIENHPDTEVDNGTVDIEKYAFGETPNSLRDIEERINQLETSPKHSPVLEKVIVGHSPRLQDYSRKSSAESFVATEEDFVSDSPKLGINQEYSNLKKVDSASEFGDDMSDRIYTVDSVHNVASFDNDPKANRGAYDELNSTRNESSYRTDIGDIEVKKLYARLHALEADRESMKQALMSMRTDKAQLVLLKEIAQHLYKDMSPPSRMPVKKRSVFGKFTIFVVFKWIASFLLWRRRARQSKYMFGMSASNAGLRMVLDKKGPQIGQWRCLSRTQLLKY
ncbi:hypothetical protein OSB04_026996 [Centaurea solstitialis]|uniref:GTD-binding domain-containing protein n=1 Tax=Centaurea solstitialis TaxID=347529 RepID=A0AA38SQG5_9ASTR|nr:hypothetical protein OSB04_026996 [Centaurea solstitialis]